MLPKLISQTQTTDQPRIVVVLFTIEGCQACTEYKPRFARIASAYREHVPILMLDANDPQNANLAGRLNVEGVPATFVLRRPSGIIRMVGSVPDSQIAWLLGVAAREAAGY